MSIIVETTIKFISGFLLIFGIYLALQGHLSPGGGFSGGVIIAGLIIINSLVFEKRPSKNLMLFLELTSLLFIMLIALIPLLFNKSFMYNFLPVSVNQSLFSSGTILIFNLLICIKVFSGLSNMFIEFYEERGQ
ncbi:MAG: Na(+)/H(+) antiporter subunit B [candidate division WS2 bacterium]|nr:Na(+)/H(+) antiporter subunit B [Candidatus Lithacetigena glycinireducens]